MTRAELEQVRAALDGLLEYIGGPKCEHEETERGGTIWTICNQCGMEFADDRGGVPVVDNSPYDEARIQLEFLSAELAKPEAREWGIQFNDGDPIDDQIYHMTESEVRQFAAFDSRRKIYSRTKPYQVPPGPWERAE